MKNSERPCSICGIESLFTEEIKSIYAVHGNDHICESCGDIANSFVNYYGKKKQKDLDALKQYLNSGVYAMTKYSRQMNAGY